ncbi:uncharacterized protein zgc:112966 [Labrus bergylta]|uniref:uncharacterized protein zgc:112966 n=1 Tax=Labrus bergylta TaxID=56723 RepID=UPI0033132BD7
MHLQVEIGDWLEDSIRWREDAAVTGREWCHFYIAVSRQSMFERGLVQWQRQKKASPANQLRVLFLGEAGIDTRALRKEFLTGKMIAGIEQKFFEKGSNGGRPNYSLSDLDKGHFRTVGEIMASSLAQGEPAPNFIVLWCYKVLCTGYLNFDNLDKDSVGDAQYTDLLTRSPHTSLDLFLDTTIRWSVSFQVEAATEATIQSLTEEILICGYTGLIHVEKREEIIWSIVLHAHLRLLLILLQIRDGLKLYGLLEIMAKHPGICQPLFVPRLEMKADADFIISVCQADFSERGTNREHLEVTLMNHLQDFLQELEQGKPQMRLLTEVQAQVHCLTVLSLRGPTVESEVEASGPQLTVEAFLQWITGQGHVPVLQEEKIRFKVNVKFEHHCESHFGEHRICYPNVAACINTITFHVKHMTSFKYFKEVLVEAFHLASLVLIFKCRPVSAYTDF